MTRLISRFATIVSWMVLVAGCTSATFPTQSAPLGSNSSGSALRDSLAMPGPITLEKVVAANWVVDRSGLINLQHPTAVAAALEAGDEPIQIYFYHLHHPEFGSFLIDSGIARSFSDPEGAKEVGWIIKQAMNTPALETLHTTGDWIEQTGTELDGVFLTHLHLDHIFGLPDVADDVPVYTGPGEQAVRSVQNIVTQGTTERLLGNIETVYEWPFTSDPEGEFAGVIDVFGDGSLWAVHVPGHTPGSTAFVVRTPTGPHLIVGDASHTAWGWRHGVEPGEFSVDQSRSALSLASLKRLAERFDFQVHPGHQSL